MTTVIKHPRFLPVNLILAIGVSSVSFAAVLIRLAGAPALTVASYRMSIATLALLPFISILERASIVAMTRRDWVLAFSSAICLALHFGFWITSLDHTSVASSVIIVTANPIFVSLLSRLLLGDPISRRTAIGISLGLFGGVFLTTGDLEFGLSSLYGNFLAVLGALAVSGYYIIGRQLRNRLSLLTYVGTVYGISSICLIAVAFLSGASLWGFSGQTFSYLILIAIIPQLIGHSSLNWALKHVSAPLVAISVMIEPVGATSLAWIILGEKPPVTTVIGGAFILAGIYHALSS